MTFSAKCISAVAAAVIFYSAAALLALAADAELIVMKPIQGISLRAGHKTGIGYFYAEAGHCKLVLTITEAAGEVPAQSFAVIRYEAAVPAGAKTLYSSADGNAFQFECGQGARTMTMSEISHVAAGAGN